MPARAYWQGQIRLALVSIPVEIYSATKSGAAISFRQIHEPSGKRIHYEKVVDGIGPVDPDEIMKGFEIAKGDYVLLDEEEIAGVKLESKRTLELTQFVDLADVDAIYYDRPYYVVPADDLADEAFIVLREALRRAKKVGLGQLALRGREYVVALKPCGRGMVLETLRYADEVNKAAGYFRDIPDAKPDEDLLDLATTLIEKKSGKFDASEFHDRYVDALRERLDAKDAGGVAALAPAYLPLIAAAGPFPQALERLQAFDTTGILASRIAGLADIVDALGDRVQLTLDPTERHGFEYQTWLGFSLFVAGATREVGRGGTYRVMREDGAEEMATGFTLYADGLGGSASHERRRLFLPYATPAAEGARMRAAGWVTVAALEPGDTPEAQLCTHILDAGVARPLGA